MTTMASATPTEIDRSLNELREGAQRWIALGPRAKAELLREIAERTFRHAARWATAAARAKGIEGTPLAGEEWMSGPWALMYALDRYTQTLERIANGQPVFDARRVRRRADGRVVADVFPNTLYDQLLLTGIRAEVWMQDGITCESLPDHTASWYRQSAHEPRVALVLGAGNIASIPPLDVLYKLLAEGAVCILKMNPVNEYLGPVFEDVLQPLVTAGYLRFAYGGAEVGKALTAHPLVDEIHITGSDRTHDAIVFGTGADAEDRKRRDDALLDKPITSELGNVSPTIVVPGPWSDADFRYHAEQIVTQKLHNGGFNCIASQVLVLPEAWSGTEKLLAQIERVMREAQARPAYYPGAAERCARLGVEGTRGIVHADARSEDAAFSTEAFAAVLVVTTLPGEGASYLRDAVAFANDRLWGTLGANIVAHPASIRALGTAFDDAIADLRYGCVAVNCWTGVGFLLADTTWGAYPGHTRGDVRSGIGVVHNAYLFDRPLKSVVHAPFRMFPKPPWFVTNRNAAAVGAALVAFQHRKRPLRLARVAMLALRG
jgi:aldehyde dehydrogenase (NAD(P)+)